MLQDTSMEGYARTPESGSKVESKEGLNDSLTHDWSTQATLTSEDYN